MTPRDDSGPDNLVNALHSKRLNFKPIDSIHAAKLYEALHHPSVHQFIDSKDFLTLQSVIDFIHRVGRGPKENSNDDWINIVCFLNDEVIGLIQATIHGTWAEVAFLFSPTFQGKGYASEAVTWMIDHIRATRSIREFWASTVPENERSIALLLRTGFLESKSLDREPLSYAPGDLVFERHR